MEQIYTFKGLMYDVFSGPKNVDLRKRFPDFNDYPEFTTPIRGDFNEVIRYIVAVYDRRGLRIYEENLNKRKKIAAELIGWKMTDGKFRKMHQEIMDGKDRVVNAMIIRFLKLHRSVEYATLVAYEEAYFNMLSKMMTEDISKSDHETFMKIEQEVIKRSADFFNGDTNKGLQNDLIEAIELDKLEFRPEDIARKLREGKEPVDYNPYEKWKPSKMKVIPEDDD